jgi:hypothetical protein
MRLQTRIRTTLGWLLLSAVLCGLASPIAQAASGVAISLENLFVPFGKQVERLNPDPSASPAGRQIGAGRETTEWIGISGFFDLNRNFRVLYGAHSTLLGSPLFKFDGSLAYVLDMPANVPIQPYFYLGATPVISTRPEIPTFGMNLHSGLGVDFIWNNTLYTQVRLNLYMLNIYGEETNQALKLQWGPASFSLSAGMGYIF